MIQQASITEKAVTRICEWLLFAGSALILFAVFLTVGDVVARHVADVGYIGLVDATQFAVVGFVYLAMPYTFLKGRHVVIELYDHVLSQKAKRISDSFACIFSVAVLCFITWFTYIQAGKAYARQTVSQNIEIAIVLFWVPIVTGLTLSALICFWHIFAGQNKKD